MSIKVSRAQLVTSAIKGELVVYIVNSSELSSINGRVDLKRPSLSAFNQLSDGSLARTIKHRGFKALSGKSCIINFPTTAPFSFLALYGQGEKGDSQFDKLEYLRNLGDFIVSSARSHGCSKVSLVANGIDLKNFSAGHALGEGLVLGGYSFNRYKKKSEQAIVDLKELQILSSDSFNPEYVNQGQIIAQSTCAARDIVNMPPSDCTPSYIVQVAKSIAKKRGLKIDVFNGKALKKMKAGALLGVAAGSDEEPYLIRLISRPKRSPKRTVALVGKGITFDSGGLSIKPSSGMEDMKCDMAGAAAVLFAMDAISQLDPRVEVRAYVPTCENMINGHAMRLGDVLHSMSGKTIEVTNTDAEGRLILADALCLAQRDGCDTIIDLATLTGACMVALGADYAGLFSEDEELAKRVEAASAISGERLWRLPIVPEYRRSLDSKVADIKNSGERWGGAITAALFLKEFVDTKAVSWAHLDIAGPAFYMRSQGYMKEGGTGFGVRTLVEFIRDL